jgi:hypothetical protein
MALTNEQIIELQKYQKLISQLEFIKSNSKNPVQKTRVSKVIDKYTKRILAISPQGIPINVYNSTFTTLNEEKTAKDKKVTNPKETATPDNKQAKGKKSVLENLVVMKISEHSSDNEINFLATLLNLMDIEYVTAISDSHLKLDFSHASERDALFRVMENIRRNMKVLTETIEEYAGCEKQDFKEQLGRMKNKQSRIFISEAADVFIKFRDFLNKIIRENQETGGSVILNIDEPINFNSKFESATILENYTVGAALERFLDFTNEAIANINIPNIKR